MEAILNPAAAVLAGLHTHNESDNRHVKLLSIGVAALGLFLLFKVVSR